MGKKKKKKQKKKSEITNEQKYLAILAELAD